MTGGVSMVQVALSSGEACIKLIYRLRKVFAQAEEIPSCRCATVRTSWWLALARPG